MRTELLEADAGSLAPLEDLLALTPGERALLSPRHPFLRNGSWRAFAAMVDGRLAARVVASVDVRQRSMAGQVGCVGFAFLGDRAAAVPVARDVLERASAWLRARGAGAVRFPVQLSTWYGHRAVTGSFPAVGGAAPFFLEPANDRRLVDLARAARFRPAHHAVSYAVTAEAVIASAAHALERLRSAGLRDRALRPADLDEELGLLYRLSTEIFRGSWAFSEISLEEFDLLYRPMAERIEPELVRILETRSGDAVGFAFAAPDPGDPRQLVVKTLGVTAEAVRRYPGSGAGLTALLHLAARGQGYERAVHALMAEGSGAHRLSRRWGTQLRTYATYERPA